MSTADTHTAWHRWKRTLTDAPLPAAIVDLDALDHNLSVIQKTFEDNAPPTLTLRPASKSIRVPWLLHYILDSHPRFRGLMTFDARETAQLASDGFDDLLLAYPPARAAEAHLLAKLAARNITLRVTIDHEDHVRLLNDAAAALNTTLRVCIDIDASLRPAGGRAHLGVRRSPIRDAAAALTLARRVRDAPHLHLDALLAYEAQIASLREHNPTSRLLDPARWAIKALSRPAVKAQRQTILDALRADGHDITLFNGGGTGSLRSTTQDPSVTEVTAGSGFLCPHLFDGHRGLDLRPAALFALPVVRISDPGRFVTCAGGGYVASGQAAPDKLPMVHLPAGLTPLAMEGFGEVQTPLQLGPAAPRLNIGDPVLCRHAKAGELAERFDTYLMVRGEQIVERAPTYRGMGWCFM